MSENFLLFIKITFRETIKHKSLYLKINFTKAELNMHVIDFNINICLVVICVLNI